MNFEQKVYKIVKKIPKGKVSTYKIIAEKVGNGLAYRAVGNTLNKSRDKRVPCHRVVRSDRKVGGFARGTREKIKILKKEGVKIKGDKIIIPYKLW